MMTTHLYRLRNIDRLLGNSQELRNQSIHFAEHAKLNDPMDGLRNLIWKGDGIVWENLFRNYIYSIHSAILSMLTTGRSVALEIPLEDLYERRGQRLGPQGHEMVEDICGRVFESTRLYDLVANLERSHRRIRREEVMVYLQTVHTTVLIEIKDTYRERGLISGEFQNSKRHRPPESFHLLPTLFDQLTTDVDSERSDVSAGLFGWHNRLLHNVSIFSRSTLCKRQGKVNEIVLSNWDLIILDFPRVYLDSIERLAYPESYVASFMKDYGSSPAWAHYADNQEGVCLVFNAERIAEQLYIELQPAAECDINDGNGLPSGETQTRAEKLRLRFYEVKYRKSLPEVAFFQSIGQLSKDIMDQNWYLDGEGNRSECYPPVGSENEKAWKDAYWERFVEVVTTKTIDWTNEQELRLLLDGLTMNSRTKQSRLFKYDFACLHGIIFGIRTKPGDKLRIIESVREKCQSVSRKDFKFYQAYYAHAENRIMKEEIGVSLLDPWIVEE